MTMGLARRRCPDLLARLHMWPGDCFCIFYYRQIPKNAIIAGDFILHVLYLSP